MKRHADIIILCEDQAHANFVWHHLKKRGFDPRKLRPRTTSSGSGAQFVLQEYAKEVKGYRSKANHLSCALLTVIDADTQDVQRIHRRLEEQLHNADVKQRKTHERIAVLVPKQNIETWIVYLQGIAVDEESDYKTHPLAENHKQAGITLAEQLGREPEAGCPQSLQLAWPELKDRLPG